MNGQGTLGQRLRDLRVRAGLSQAQLAFPELSDSYISLIESDKRKPTASVIQFLAKKLECSSRYLESGITESAFDDLRMELQYSQIALQNGEVAEALRQYAEIKNRCDSEVLCDILYEARSGYAAALEADGQLD